MKKELSRWPAQTLLESVATDVLSVALPKTDTLCQNVGSCENITTNCNKEIPGWLKRRVKTVCDCSQFLGNEQLVDAVDTGSRPSPQVMKSENRHKIRSLQTRISTLARDFENECTIGY